MATPIGSGDAVEVRIQVGLNRLGIRKFHGSNVNRLARVIVKLHVRVTHESTRARESHVLGPKRFLDVPSDVIHVIRVGASFSIVLKRIFG